MTTFGRYVLDKRIARGGMAEVYRARLRGADGFEKVMCIKCILPHLARMSAFGAMFRDEAAIAALLHHQNVVQVFDYGEVDGTLFIAMEYVDGVSLARVLDSDEPLHMAAALKIGIDVCKGLHHAHTARRDGRALGIVHRDVSPQNILITRQGDVKVTDFGVARAEGRRTETASGVVKGKVQYMAPEQIVGRAFDHRLDQFSTGVVLWEALTGEPLFRGATDYIILDAIANAQVPPPSSLRPEIPPSVDAAILRALEKDPRDRFPDMEQLAQALTQCMSQMPVFPGDVPGPAALDLVPLIDRVMMKMLAAGDGGDDGDDGDDDDDGDDGDDGDGRKTISDDFVATIATPLRENARNDDANANEASANNASANNASANEASAATRALRVSPKADRRKRPALLGRASAIVIASLLVGAGLIGAAMAGPLGDARRPRSAAALTCPAGFARVEGERDVAPFCIAMFEMKRAEGGAVASRAEGTPIQDVTRDHAVQLCGALGAGFHLVTNDEWQALAHDIEHVAANWSGGAVGSGVLASGNSGVVAGPASTSDPCATPGNPTRFPRCLDAASRDFVFRRTHHLASGDVVWDVGSNATEWTATDTSDEVPSDVRAAACLAEGKARRAYGPSGDYECGTAPNPLMFGCLEGSNGPVVVRGGSSMFAGTPWDSCPGIFYANVNEYWDATTKAGHAFRCAWR